MSMVGNPILKNTLNQDLLNFMNHIGYQRDLVMIPEGYNILSLILTKQMSRVEALDKLKKPAYDKNDIEDEFEYIAMKLDISTDELKNILICQKILLGLQESTINI